MFTYRATPLAGGRLNPPRLDRAVLVLRRRLDALRVPQVTVTRSGPVIRVTLPAVQKTTVARGQIAAPAQLRFYDWEPNVIGPEGTPSPRDPSVTGGAAAGGPGAGSISRYAAVLRAGRRPRVARPEASTGDQVYLVNTTAKKVLAGPADTRADLLGRVHIGRRTADERFVRVKQGTVIVRAESTTPGRKIDQWFVLDDDAALTAADITNPGVSVDRATKTAAVTFDFTERGKQLWRDVTRRIAQRGQAAQRPGTPTERAAQHFAIALDDELITVPFIDFKHNPDGIDATNGSQLEGGFTTASARRLAALLKGGALPVRLNLLSVRPTRLP